MSASQLKMTHHVVQNPSCMVDTRRETDIYTYIYADSTARTLCDNGLASHGRTNSQPFRKKRENHILGDKLYERRKLSTSWRSYQVCNKIYILVYIYIWSKASMRSTQLLNSTFSIGNLISFHF